LKTYYELLSVDPMAPPSEIKRAFRKEIARYHPDKVQHLGHEFQTIAATRAAELTEAYRILMDPAARQKYDDMLASDERSQDEGPTPAAPAPAHAGASRSRSTPRSEPPHKDTPVPESVRKTRATMGDFVKKATLARLREAVQNVFGDAESLPLSGFDAAYATRSRGGLFKKTPTPMRLLARVVPEVTGAAIQETWPMALKAASGDMLVCLLLLGSGLAPARELAATIADMRRKSRGAGPCVIPVDVRDWEALFPADAPSACRRVIEKLKQAQ
jgi:DnaJ-like protein